MRSQFLTFGLLLFPVQGLTNGNKPANDNTLCNIAWYQQVEQKVSTGDGDGHGPDLGSMEWRSVVEFKLKIRGQAEIPARETEKWCEYIDRRYINPQ